MEKTVKLWLNILIFIFLMLVLSFVISLNFGSNKEILLILATILIISVSIRYLFFYESIRFYNWGLISIFFDVIVIFLFNRMDKYGIMKIFYLVLVGESILFYPVLFSLILIIFCYVIYLISIYAESSYSNVREFLPNVLTSLIAVIFITIIMAIVRYVIRQHSIISRTMGELNDAHAQLKEKSLQLQQMALVKERNRIAGEVHDTVGHTLTTVLVEIQAYKRLAGKAPDKAAQKLDMAEEQVRKGLNDIMKSVRSINKDNGLEDINLAIRKLIEGTEEHAGVKIRYNLSEMPEINEEIRKIIYRALKEGLTNGIRHGKSTEFEFELIVNSNNIFFTLKDNGIGCEEFTPGFGIQTLMDRLMAFNGTLQIQSAASNGFRLDIKIPLER